MEKSINPPYVFISYSHDSNEHSDWVRKFATTLRERGIDAELDQWNLNLGVDIANSIEQFINQAKYVLIICTTAYIKKANSGKGGVGFEKGLICADYLNSAIKTKAIPIIREKNNDDSDVPNFLKGKMYVDFTSNLESEIEKSLDTLLRHLSDTPLHEKPPIGQNTFKFIKNSKPNESTDGIKAIMMAIAKAYDITPFRGITLLQILKCTTIRRIAVDRYIEEAIQKGFLKYPDGLSNYQYILTDTGSKYLEDNNIVQF